MGKSGGGASVPQSPTDAAQAAILNNLEATVGQPIRDVVMPQVLSTLAGPGVFQTTLPAADRQAIEDQFKQAEGNIYATGQRGGQLNQQLTDLNSARAGSVAEATANAKQLGIERALGLVPAGIPNASTTMSAMSALGNSEQSRLNAEAQMAAQQDAAKGSGMGSLAGAGMMAASMAGYF